jgi:hypothetical protein
VLDRLQVHLRPYSRRGDLDLRDDTRIGAGEQWRAAIREAIEKAAASVLLISADFLASDFVASEELPGLQQAERAGARVIDGHLDGPLAPTSDPHRKRYGTSGSRDQRLP